MCVCAIRREANKFCSNICRYSKLNRREEKEIIIAVTSTYFIVSLLHSRLRFMTSNFLLPFRIMAVNLCISANLSSWPLKIFQDPFFIRRRGFFLSFLKYFILQFSINYRWNNLLKCSNCFEANFISIHLIHDIPQTSCRIHIDTILLFCCAFFSYFAVNMQLTSVFRYWCLSCAYNYNQYRTIFYIIYRPIIQHKRYISVQHTDANYQCHFHFGENLWFK